MKISKERIKQLIKEAITEKWSKKHKASIDCNNSKGFFLNESYKLTFQDKKNIENEIRKEYESYLKPILKKNADVDQMKDFNPIEVIEKIKIDISPEQYEKLLAQLISMKNISKEKIKPFNQFYKENIDYITKDYIRRNQNSSKTNFNYPMKPVNDAESYYETLSSEELKSIKRFLTYVGIRIASGTGESIDRVTVRNAFFKTPIRFQKMFSEKPNPYLWRGDYAHPSDEDYDKEDKEYLAMQSFSTYKNTAKEFGTHFSAINIKSYGGSFSVPKFIDYGESDLLGNFDLADDEGEVMFFDVNYK